MNKTYLLLPILFCLSACNAGRYYDETYAEEPANLQLGTVQRGIFEGMSQSEVACALGAPNIVTRDKEGRETWIYDKIATEVKKSGSSGLILFCQTGADYVTRSQVSQRTLTVVIKFTTMNTVDNVTYHSSKF